MKRALLLLCVLLALAILPGAARAEPEEPDISVEDAVEKWLDELGLAQWQANANEAGNAYDLFRFSELTAWIREYALTGEAPTQEITQQWLLSAVRQELGRCAGLFFSLLGISILSGVAKTVAGQGKTSAAEAAGFACRCFTLAVVLSVFASLTKACVEAIRALSAFMQIALPALLTVLTAMGGTASAGVIQPATTFLCGGMTTAMQGIVVPVALCGGILGVINCLGSGDRLGGMVTLAKKSVKWTVGIATSLYLGVTSIRGLSAAAYDGISVRTAKYAASNLVPFVGGFVSGTMDTLLGCAGLVKNAAGLAAVMIGASIVFAPLLRIFLYMTMFRVSIALTQPISEPPQIRMQTEACEMLSCYIAAMIATTLMFFVTTGLITSIGGVAG